MSVPPTFPANMPNYAKCLMFLFVLSAVVCSCSSTSSASVNSTQVNKIPTATQPTAQEPSTTEPCQRAPDWLVTELGQGLLIRGAYLSEVYIGTASDFTSGPATVLNKDFIPAWWVAAKINGAGIQPEVGLWVVGPIRGSKAGQLFGANAAALRYTSWGSDDTESIRGKGADAVLTCLTPIPKP